MATKPRSSSRESSPPAAPAAEAPKTKAAPARPRPAAATPKAPKATKGLSYEAAGVSIREGDALVERLKKNNPSIGGFSGAFPLELKGIKKPVLLASTDGVGTKLLLAQKMEKLDTVGIDLVAMVINDLLVCGAQPLFFLDYYATGRLTAAEGDAVLAGIQRGCQQAGIPLLGGETAEMPGLYKPGDFDLAGFSVGLADRDSLIDGSEVKPGDVVVGIASSGVHSNGYSLVRAIIDRAGLDLSKHHEELGATLGEALMRPTRIYSKVVARLLDEARPRAMAHITGGGLAGNLERVLPEGCQAIIDATTWPVPPIFPFLQKHGQVAVGEMRKVFNMGIGLAVVVRPRKASACIAAAAAEGDQAWVIGSIGEGKRGVKYGRLPKAEV